ncbi:MAG: hypothetical protein R3301_15685 [Saprospiraceae bacterium]|nr:hypothetical protein [Saprospiraceae bacterium]
MKSKLICLLATAGLVVSAAVSHAQDNIGLHTQTPDAPVHIFSSGQVNVPGGLLLLGNRAEGHLEVDFNLLQSRFGANSHLPLRLNPDGGDVGVNTFLPDAPFHLFTAGQVNTPGGVFLLGNRNEAYLEVDFNILQSKFGAASYIPLLLQPEGGDLNVGDGLIYADRTNNFVGINHDSPDTELRVHGEMRMSTSGFATAQKDKISLHGVLESEGMVGLGWIKSAGGIGTGGSATSGPANRSMIDIYEMYYRSQGAHRWFINELADVNSPEMILDEDGKLGIGPDDPDSKLHVTGGEGASLSGLGFAQFGTTGGLNVVMDNNEILARNNGTPSTLYLQYWAGNVSLAADDNGKVGIGVSAPLAKLQITDGVDASYAGHGSIMIGSHLFSNLVIDENEILARDNGGASPLYLQRDGGDLMLCALEGGQVGIGITDPANLPDPSFLLAVDGKIISEEVRVELSGDWPDYVFREDYHLKPLAQLSDEIGSLGHLPGMPSARTVEEEGFELGDMQRRLVEKVEELTLYVIELDAANRALRAELAELKNAIDNK